LQRALFTLGRFPFPIPIFDHEALLLGSSHLPLGSSEFMHWIGTVRLTFLTSLQNFMALESVKDFKIAQWRIVNNMKYINTDVCFHVRSHDLIGTSPEKVLLLKKCYGHKHVNAETNVLKFLCIIKCDWNIGCSKIICKCDFNTKGTPTGFILWSSGNAEFTCRPTIL
jgi:hypothetical protein